MNIEAEDDDDLLNELDHELKIHKQVKLVSKRNLSTSHKNPTKQSTVQY